MSSFTELKAWQKGMLLVENIYTVTKAFPRNEIYGLISQLKRSSTSVLANIAEGHGRFTFNDKAAKFIIARGECTEVNAFLHIAQHLGFGNSEQLKDGIALTEEVGKILSGLIRSCKNRSLASN